MDAFVHTFTHSKETSIEERLVTALEKHGEPVVQRAESDEKQELEDMSRQDLEEETGQARQVIENYRKGSREGVPLDPKVYDGQ
jgi:hypothetical protein